MINADWPVEWATRALEPVSLRHGVRTLADPAIVGKVENVRLGEGWEPVDGKTGVLRTAIVRFVAGKSSRLVLHADASDGQILVQFRDACGQVIPGYSFDECVPITGAGPQHPVQWFRKVEHLGPGQGWGEQRPGLADLARLDRQSVSVEFALTNARLDGFCIEPGQELPLRLGDGPHLFIDDYLIADTSNLTRVKHPPQRLAEPVVPAHAATAALNYDPQRQVLQMWAARAGRCDIFYLESKDGLEWSGPDEPVLKFDGWGLGVVDDGPDCPDPQRRYKYAYFCDPPHRIGMYVAFSPDGIHWEQYEGNPVLHSYGPRQLWTKGVHDNISGAYWDPIRKHYACFMKMWSMGTDEFGLRSRTSEERLEGGVRLCGQTSSPDFMHWEHPHRAFVPDDGDEGVTEFYSAAVLVRGDLLIAFQSILRDDLPKDEDAELLGIGYTVLATSRDGRWWQRDREPFLDRNPQPNTYDRAVAWIHGAVQVEDRVYLSYAAFDTGHKGGSRQVSIATLPADRFVSRQAVGTEPGTLLTHLLTYTGRNPMALFVNADAGGGESLVRILDVDNNVVAGFDYDQCEPLTSSELHHPMRWSRPLAELAGQSFRLEFRLRNAHLYGFHFD